MTSVKRWHTDSIEPTPVDFSPKELSQLVNTNSNEPLYLQIENAKNGPLSPEDAQWLNSVYESFDSYVTSALNTLRIKPWDHDFRIKEEYEQTYTTAPPSDLPIRGVMGRLMSYKEIWNYVYEAEGTVKHCASRSLSPSDWFWRKPEPVPVWSIDCLSSNISKPKSFMTGLNESFPNRVYQVVFEQPWGANLDPTHHWGVYVDKGNRFSNNDSPIRTLMACCAEPVGHTEGCWISLKDDTGAIEGVIKPYQVYSKGVFDGIWSKITESNANVTQDEIKQSYSMGTGFKDAQKYEILHSQIKTALENAAPILAQAYIDYQTVLQKTLDDTENDLMRETNPFESILLTQTNKDIVSLPIRLQHEFNTIQCLGSMNPPIMRDYVNKKVFKVDEMLKEFTYEKMGGIIITLSGNKPYRVKMFKTTIIEDVSVLRSFVEKRNFWGLDPRVIQLNIIADLVQQIRIRLDAFNDPIEIQRKEKLESLQKYSDQLPSTYKPKWIDLQGRLRENELLRVLILRKQSEINEHFRSLRKEREKWTSPDVYALPEYQTLKVSPQDELLEAEFEENIQVAKIVYEINNLLESNKEPKSDDIVDNQEAYTIIYNTFKRIEKIESSINLTDSKFKTVNEMVDVIKSKITFTENMRKNLDLLQKSKKKFRYLAYKHRFLKAKNLQKAVSDKVFEKALLSDIYKSVSTEFVEIETTIQSIQLDWQKFIESKEKEYKQIQEKRKEDANLIITILFGKLSKMPGSITSLIDAGVDLLTVLYPLSAVDGWDQQYIDFNKRIKNLVNTLPKRDYSFTLNDKYPQYKTPEEIELAYIDKWTNNNGLFAQCLSLLSNLRALLNTLDNSTAAADNINTILVGAEKQGEEAADLIEDAAKRLARLKREEEERQRLAREEERKRLANDRETVNRNRNRFNKISVWLNMKDDMFLKYSSEGLSSEQGLRDNGLVYTDEEMQWPVFREGGYLPNQFEFEIPKSQDPYTRVLFERYTPIIEQTWKAFGDYVLFRGTSEQQAKKTYLESLFSQYRQVLSRQPGKVEDIIQEVSTTIFRDEFNNLKMPPDSMFYSNTFIWNLNSCWLDSSFVALFGYPGNKLAQHIMTKGNMFYKQKEITWEFSSEKLMVDYGCAPDDLRKLHEIIVSDIMRIESPLPVNPVCPLKTRNEWTKCVKSPFKIDPLTKNAEGLFGEASSVFETIKELYNIEDLQIEVSPIDAATSMKSSDVVVNANPNTRFYAFDTLWKNTEPDSRGELNVQMDHPNFTLSAIICGSGRHFVTYLYDFIVKRWMFINVGDEPKNSAWNFLVTLPLDIHNIQKAAFKPSIYLYLRKDDIAILTTRNLPKPPPLVPFNAKTNVWDSKFKTKSIEEIYKNLNERYNDFGGKEKDTWAKQLGLLLDDGFFIQGIKEKHPFKNMYTIPNAVREDTTRMMILRYAWANYFEWLGDIKAKNRRLESNMRKALAALQLEPFVDDYAKEMSLFNIKYYPEKESQIQALETVFKSLKDTSPKFVASRKRILGVQLQFNFAELEN
jgi:hypothetical protein